MAEVLQLAHLVQYDSVAQMQVGCSRVQAQFDAQWNTGFLGTR